MSAAETAKSLLAAWEAGDIDKSKSLLADDFVLTGPAPEPVNKEAFFVFQQVHNEAFPDWKFNARLVEEKGNTVRLRIQITATHTGIYDVFKLDLPIPPIAATGKRRSWSEEFLTFTVEGRLITRIDAQIAPDGGVIGTLEWLGVRVPSV